MVAQNPYVTLMEMKEQAFPQFTQSVQELLAGFKEPFLFAKKLYADNSLRELAGGKLRVSEKTLNELVQKALAGREELKSLSLSLQEGYILGEAVGTVKENPFKVSFQVQEIKISLTGEKKEICFILPEPPRVELRDQFKNIFLKLAASIIRSLHGEGRINELLFKDLDSVSVKGNQVAVDLKRSPVLSQVVEADILGVKIFDLVRLDKVELHEGVLYFLGGLKAPAKLQGGDGCPPTIHLRSGEISG